MGSDVGRLRVADSSGHCWRPPTTTAARPRSLLPTIGCVHRAGCGAPPVYGRCIGGTGARCCCHQGSCPLGLLGSPTSNCFEELPAQYSVKRGVQPMQTTTACPHAHQLAELCLLHPLPRVHLHEQENMCVKLLTSLCTVGIPGHSVREKHQPAPGHQHQRPRTASARPYKKGRHPWLVVMIQRVGCCSAWQIVLNGLRSKNAHCQRVCAVVCAFYTGSDADKERRKKWGQKAEITKLKKLKLEIPVSAAVSSASARQYSG